MGEVMYVVLVSDENEEHTNIHSMFRDEGKAEKAKKALESSLHDMIVRVESHEISE